MKTFLVLGAAAFAVTPGGTDRAPSDCCAPQASTEATCCEAEAPPTFAPIAQPVVAFPTYPADETGAIAGRVKWEGDVPEPLPALTIEPDKSQGCTHGEAMDKTDRTRLIDKSGGIANVVVSIEVEGEELRAPEEPFVLDQRSCRFEPHVLVMPVGSKGQYLNSDEINHNVHTYSKKNDALNRNVAGGSKEIQTLERDEEFQVKCDIHPWMASWVIVTEDTRYAVTDAKGDFRLEGLPPGKYKVSYWHETLGKGKSEEVEVAAGGTASLDIEMGEDGGGRGGRRGRGRR